MSKAKDCKIYLRETGSEEISSNGKDPAACYGWREEPSGSRIEVVYFGGEWGWMSFDERFEACQTHPKIAP